jgi:DNA-binding transcriptional LysR family regulator
LFIRPSRPIRRPISWGSRYAHRLHRGHYGYGRADALPEPLCADTEIATEEALIDVLGQGFDAGIRLADTVAPDKIAVPILPTIRSVVVGAPGYFVGRRRTVVPAHLLRHQCIRSRMGTGKLHRWEFERRGKTMLIDAPGSLLSSF